MHTERQPGCGDRRRGRPQGTSRGKRVARPGSESGQIVKGVPNRWITGDGLRQAVKTRQAAVSVKYVDVADGICRHHRKSRLSRTCRPKTPIPGLVLCGCFGEPFSLRDSDRFACLTHATKRTAPTTAPSCAKKPEEPGACRLQGTDHARSRRGSDARLCVETNRLNREHGSNDDAWKAELVKVEKQVRGIIETIRKDVLHPSIKDGCAGNAQRQTDQRTRQRSREQPGPAAASAIDELPQAATVLRMLSEKKNEPTPGPNAENSKPHCIANCGRNGKLLDMLQKNKHPQRALRVCRTQWLRGRATIFTCDRPIRFAPCCSRWKQRSLARYFAQPRRK